MNRRIALLPLPAFWAILVAESLAAAWLTLRVASAVASVL